MFSKESEWISTEIQKLLEMNSAKSLLNIGSSTRKFREHDQPFIYLNIFEPLEGKLHVTHLDLKEAEGVDLVGDLTDPSFFERNISKCYDIVLCSNLLEHVLDANSMCDGIAKCVSNDGYIIITVPRLYPYHNDPIDTLFRPSPTELAGFFPTFDVVHSEVLTIDDTHQKLLSRNWKLLLIFSLRILSPFYKPANWLKIVSDVPILCEQFQVTCIVLKNKAFGL